MACAESKPQASYLSRDMARRQIMSILLGLVPALATPPEGTLVPPVQGAYVGFRWQGTANPYDASFSCNLGWREVLYEAENPALAYNFIGMEFLSNTAAHELSVGARMFVQPTSFLQTGLSYERIGFPFGVLSLAGHPERTEDDVWTESYHLSPAWPDMFTWKWSVHREVGSFQGKFQGYWSRIDIDKSMDSIYVPNNDIVCRSRDDIMGLDMSLGYVFETPFLAAVGPVYSYATSVDHDIEQGRGGIWMQAWPFSSRSGEIIPYWTLRSRVDLWANHSSRQWQPRFELTLGWERNIFQPDR